MTTDALIFDLDGTLWDTSAACAQSWNAVMEELGVARTPVSGDEIRAVMGLPHRQAVSRVLVGFSESLIDRFSARTEVEDNRAVEALGGDLYEGVAEFVPRLAERFRLMIVSNCQSGYIEIFRAQSGLDACFVDHECWGDSGRDKADNLAAIIARNGVRRPVFVGDTEGDRRAAAAVGAVFVYASYGFGVLEDADHTIATFGELPEVVGRDFA